MNAVPLVLCLVFHFAEAGKDPSGEKQNKTTTSSPNSCPVFCSGKILHHVQVSRIFNSSQYFVNLKCKEDPQLLESKFESMLTSQKGSLNASALHKFVDDHFDVQNSEFEKWIPLDWNPNPTFIARVYDMPLRQWLHSLNDIWRTLGRRVSSKVDENKELYSLLYVPNPLIIQGEGVEESLHWDTYWTIEGLLICELYNTAKGMIENLLYLVNQYGYVPNGGRKYLLNRTQPPYLIPMVQLYLQATEDQEFLKNSIDTLEKEFEFWRKHRSKHVTVKGITYFIFQYKTDGFGPRPEFYFEDFKSSIHLNKTDKLRYYSDLNSAGESGWDLSSRWFIENDKRTGRVKDIKTTSIIPVCLNSLMGYNARIMAQFYSQLGNVEKSNMYNRMAKSINVTVSRLFWNDEEGIWLDYNMETAAHQTGFYLSNFMPLWTETYGQEREPAYVVGRVLNYLEQNQVNKFHGGVPASLFRSNETWDLPNGFAPLQHILILGLEKAGKHDPQAKDLALNLASRWILNNFNTYHNSTPPSMFEKYDVVLGGIDDNARPQKFGWTSGVAMKLLSLYGHQIKTRNDPDIAPVVMFIMLITVAALSISSYMYRVNNCFLGNVVLFKQRKNNVV
ncbi:trehalase-like [Oratosquilla oratoria]|uniref:trehalase-like n=1 Tax=Oratosquilla oratoria TaxID=337810 RepID=UPI003F766013